MTRNNKRLLFAFKFLGLFLLYFVTAKAGLKLNAVNGFATLVWPPSGIALAALLIFGYRFWPAIALGAFLVNFTSGASFLVAIGITIGNTLESLIGVYLLRQIGFHYSLEHLKDVLGLVGFGALLSTLISATVGVSSLFLSHTIPYESFFSTWSAWWIGDMLGILLVASFLLAWSGNFLPKLSLKKVAELLVIISLLLITSAIVFSDFFKAGPEYHPFTYIIFPPLIWIALRFD